MVVVLYLCFLVVVGFVKALPEPGVWTVKYNKKEDIHAFPKSVYSNTKISVIVSCPSNSSVQLTVEWLVRLSPCAQEYDGIETQTERTLQYLGQPHVQSGLNFDYKKVEYMQNKTHAMCGDSGTGFNLPDYTSQSPKVVDVFMVSGSTSKNQTGKTTLSPKDKPKSTEKPKKKRDVAAAAPPPPASVPANKPLNTNDKIDQHNVVKIWKDGYYVFILRLSPSDGISEFEAEVTVRMLGDHGYISAVEYPLEIFYGVMGLFYIGYGVFWLVLLACNWRDLLRVQFWIGGVIVLGMLEKAVFFAEYQNIAKTGMSVRGAVIFAELVSCLKRTLARMLVIVVSLGFGIVKPRLGQAFHKVLCVGILYFILGSIEGCMRALRSKSDQSQEMMLAAVPLAVVDAVICWWIFSSLVQTTRTLRLRRNIVKLSLYRHFTNTLIFAVLASIAYMIWSITQHKLKTCVTDWKELWVDEAFWHLLFSVILLIIMILWRPNANNQRYAFSPLLDAAEDEVDDDQMMNDAFDGMKMRGVKGQANGSPKQKEVKYKADDDLKWVEENIPSSVADKALPSLLDSDEELMTTKFEMSKME